MTILPKEIPLNILDKTCHKDSGPCDSEKAKYWSGCNVCLLFGISALCPEAEL